MCPVKKSKVRELDIGIYRIFWKNDGGVSLAAVGQLHDGTKWLAPCNWTSEKKFIASTDYWKQVKRVEFIPLRKDNEE